MTPAVAAEVDRYLRTGDTDIYRSAWAGGHYDRCVAARRDLRDALVAEVLARTAKTPPRSTPSGDDLVALTRRKVEPMVRGLFPRAEQDIVLALLERSVVFLTPATLGDVLRDDGFDRTAWNLANLYLASVGAPLLGPDALDIVGMSQETTCFLTAAYFDQEDHPFADFLVHEAAHVFHNSKRQPIGLPFTRRREWLLRIDFRKRETFAYACEAFARIVERAPRPADRPALAAGFDGFHTETLGVDDDEVADIVREAAGRRNGWKVILSRCAPPTRSRTA
jgi:hypothetical protein